MLNAIKSRFRPTGDRNGDHDTARRYLDAVGVLKFLKSGRADEFAVVPYDMQILHQHIRTSKPRQVLEYGCGFSSVVIAHALKCNHDENPELKPMATAVETDAKWAENARGKLPDELAPYIEIVHSELVVDTLDGSLCHYYAQHPNIVPNFVFLDGPYPPHAINDFMGHKPSKPLAADIILYEFLLRRGFVMIVDGRRANVEFLKHNLKREWSTSFNQKHNYTTFKLES